MFYRFEPRGDGLVDVWLTPGTAVPITETTGRMEFSIKTYVVRGIDPKDPQWGGCLEAHVREHYQDWLDAAEEIEI